MRPLKFLLVVSLPVLTLLAGCVTSRSIYTASGQHGYEITCNGHGNSWEDCLAKAGNLCRAQGYTVLEKNGERIPFAFSSAYANSESKAKLFSYEEHDTSSALSASGLAMHRSMLISCGTRRP